MEKAARQSLEDAGTLAASHPNWIETMPCPIRDWFATHEDGDFFIAPRSQSLSVAPPHTTADTVVYCTKQHCLSRLIPGAGDPPSFGAVLRCGLPSDADVGALASIVGKRRLLFLGDADPPDLLIFSWLRERIDIHYLGVSDELLRRCSVELSDHLSIPLSDTEAAAMPLVLKSGVDLQSQLGAWCSSWLTSGKKIELEALFNFARCTPTELAAKLVA